jgi:hypothetical protein
MGAFTFHAMRQAASRKLTQVIHDADILTQRDAKRPIQIPFWAQPTRGDDCINCVKSKN